MKNWITQIIGVCAAVLFFSSCEKEEVQAVAQPGEGSKITASASKVMLLQDDADKSAVTLKWTPANFGYNAAQNYTLQFDKQGNKFAKPYDIKVGSATEKTLTVREVNSAMLALGLSPSSESTVEVRVISSVGDAVKSVASSAVTLSGTPYRSFIQYPSLYLPGGYQNWDPPTAPFVASPNNNKMYEGYINFASGSEFKFTPARNWDNDYGTDGTPDGLQAKGGNLSTAAGYYKINVDLNTLKYTMTPTTWAVIGSATPGDWSTETPMTYDATKGVWMATVNLTSGADKKLKFRANNGWTINLGDNDANGSLEYGGADILSPGTGSYTITLDLSQGNGNYSYSFSKN